jgi:RNA recognition motif-containing protein
MEAYVVVDQLERTSRGYGFIAYDDEEDAKRREKYLKTHYGKMFLKNRLKSYFTGRTK